MAVYFWHRLLNVYNKKGRNSQLCLTWCGTNITWLICATFILMFLVNPFRKSHFPQWFLVPNSLQQRRHLCLSILTTQFQLRVRSPGLNVRWLLSSLSILLINLQNKQSHERGGRADQQGLRESTESLIMGIISRYHSSPSWTHLFIETICWRNQYWQKHVVFQGGTCGWFSELISCWTQSAGRRWLAS